MTEQTTIALIGAVATVTSVVAPILVGRWLDRSIAKRVGTPNGEGDLIQMVDRLLESDREQDRRHDQTEDRMGRILTRLGRIEKRLSRLEEAA